MRYLRRELDSLILSKDIRCGDMGVARWFEAQRIPCEGLFVYHLYPGYIIAEKSIRNGPYAHFQSIFSLINLDMTLTA